MSLQAALIVIGLVLLVGIYMVSRMLEGKKFNRGNINHVRHDMDSDSGIDSGMDSIDDSSWQNSEPNLSEPSLSESGLSEPAMEDDIPVLDMEVDSNLYESQNQVADTHSTINYSSSEDYDNAQYTEQEAAGVSAQPEIDVNETDNNAGDNSIDMISDQIASDEIETLDDFVYPDEISDDVSDEASDEAPNQILFSDQPDISISENIEDVVELEDDLKIEASADQGSKQSSELPMEEQTEPIIEVKNIDIGDMPILDGPEWELELVNDNEQKSLFEESVDDDSEIIDWENLRSTNAIDTFISNNPDDQQISTETDAASITESDEQSALSNDEELMDELDDFHFEKDESRLPMQNDPVSSKAKPATVEGHHRPERIEPKLSGFEAPGQTVLPFADEESSKASPDYRYPSIPGFDRISQIDYWVKFSGEKDIGRESVLAQYREPVSSISKTSRIYGRKIPDKAWCLLENESEEARFSDLVVTLQLADKNGPITQLDLDKFTSMIVKLSDGIGRDYSLMAPTESAMQQGKAISDFIRYYETVFVVNIKPVQSDYFDGVTINRCATQLGLDRSADKYFVRNKMVGKEKVSIYYLANMNSDGEFDFDSLKESNIKGVTFFTKPAVNKSPGAVFTEMIDTAKAFAARAKGEAIMPNHEDFSQDDIDHIRKSIEKVAQEMETLGIATGSDEAIRIF